jgi:hypothetical protein
MAAKKKKPAKPAAAKHTVKSKKPAKKVVKPVKAAAAKAHAKKKPASAPAKAKASILKKSATKKAAPARTAPPVAAKKPVPHREPKKDVHQKAHVEVKPKALKEKPVVEEPVIEPAVVEEEPAEVVLTDSEGRRYCRVKDCDQLAVVDVYCRYHYLLFWKKIQVRKKILAEGKLERYIEELTARYPDKFLDMLRKDLRSEKEFLAAIQELEIDESANENEFEDEAQTFIDEVRGISETSPTRDDDEF